MKVKELIALLQTLPQDDVITSVNLSTSNIVFTVPQTQITAAAQQGCADTSREKPKRSYLPRLKCAY